ncbi:hypothetical protein HHX48_04405 [Salinimonas sp. HHU 13199]|uniref:Uncharacterized protein n=1 Tax=Salinimonas profundi TaxID=2729140 RepID=A0ABR8LHH4_9ALTE|nr:hypothetical protein [Salinimonas profundi]MBD3584978.1 hypothetical protein [Salinimonas profundi]
MRLLFGLICLGYAWSLPLLLEQQMTALIAGGAIIAGIGLLILIHSDAKRTRRERQI